MKFDHYTEEVIINQWTKLMKTEVHLFWLYAMPNRLMRVAIVTRDLLGVVLTRR